MLGVSTFAIIALVLASLATFFSINVGKAQKDAEEQKEIVEEQRDLAKQAQKGAEEQLDRAEKAEGKGKRAS